MPDVHQGHCCLERKNWERKRERKWSDVSKRVDAPRGCFGWSHIPSCNLRETGHPDTLFNRGFISTPGSPVGTNAAQENNIWFCIDGSCYGFMFGVRRKIEAQLNDSLGYMYWGMTKWECRTRSGRAGLPVGSGRRGNGGPRGCPFWSLRPLFMSASMHGVPRLSHRCWCPITG